MKPILSVIICTFNRADCLNNCLRSLTKQTFKDFEVIIVDGKSTDDTKKIIEKYNKKLSIKTYVFEEKELAKVRDLGWRKAKGKIVAWIDDDVIVSKNWAKSAVEILEENPRIGGVSGPTIIPKNLIANRDVFSFYHKRGFWKIVGTFWESFFLEGKKYEPGRILKSGAWTPGSNFKQCLKIKNLTDVDYLEACNMFLRKNLIKKVNGFDFTYKGVAEWSELDLAIRIKNLGYGLVFSPKVKVEHHISKGGIFTRRNIAKQRMENFFKFYFRHIYKPKINYIIKFALYVIFLNFYYLYKSVKEKNLNWLGGCWGTFTGFKSQFKRNTSFEPHTLNQRYQANKTAKFQNTQTKLFLTLIKNAKNTLEVGCGQGYFSYVAAINKKINRLSLCDIVNNLSRDEISKYVKTISYKEIKQGILPYREKSFDLVFSVDVIEHVGNDTQIIAEMFRVCQKNGQIIIGTPNYWRIGNLPAIITGQLRFPKNIGDNENGQNIHVREYKRQQLVDLVIRVAGDKLRPGEISIFPCWLGVLPFNIGFDHFSQIFNRICNFYFVKVEKTW